MSILRTPNYCQCSFKKKALLFIYFLRSVLFKLKKCRKKTLQAVLHLPTLQNLLSHFSLFLLPTECVLWFGMHTQEQRYGLSLPTGARTSGITKIYKQFPNCYHLLFILYFALHLPFQWFFFEKARVQKCFI